MRPLPADHVADPVRDVSVLNWANLLTVVRLLLVPLFAWLLLRELGGDDADRVLAAIVFVVAGSTDLIDGELARRRGLVTTFGKVADPIADKLLVGTALVLLSAFGDLPWWVTAVILVREIGVTVLRFVVLRRGVIAASRGGKAKTAFQMLAILLYLLPLGGFWVTLRTGVLAVALVLTVVTGVDYLVRAARVWRAGRRARPGADRP